MTRINCEEYAHGHEIAKLLGSPPGYIGHNVEPLLSQRRIDMHHRHPKQEQNEASDVTERTDFVNRLVPSGKGQYVSVILFDEIEKAAPGVWSALLGILEDGMLTLGDNTTTDFTRSVILMTSNVGSREISELLERRPVGFFADDQGLHSDHDSIRVTALRAARNHFPPEFLNRFDEILVYSALEPSDLKRIFDKFLSDIHERALKQARVPLLIKVSREARAMIIERGTDLSLGARPLRRAMERDLVDPLSRLIASQKVQAGDVVEVELEGEDLAFYRKPRRSETVIV